MPGGRGAGGGGGRGGGYGRGAGGGRCGGQGRGMGQGRREMDRSAEAVRAEPSTPASSPQGHELDWLKEQERALEGELDKVRKTIESMSAEQPQVRHKARIDELVCMLCRACVPMCPEQAIEFGDKAVVNQDRCSGCGICVNMCPVGAVQLVEVA